MNKTYLVALVATLLIAPVALAHEPAGTPKNYCEDPSEWDTHDYGPPGTSILIFLGQDGNIAGDCNADTVPADFDGHIEFAHGGGWLSAESGDGVTSGSIACYGEVGHHPTFGPFGVTDVVFGAVQFTVAADTTYGPAGNPDPTTDCGDFESDVSEDCVGTCTVTFPAGKDGTYQVYVCGSAGHISGSGPSGPAGLDCGLAIAKAGCTTTFVLETADNALAYPTNVTNNGPFNATDQFVLDQRDDTSTFLGCAV